MGAATGQKALTFLWSFLCCHCPQIRFCSPSCRAADPLCSWSSAPGDLPAAPVRSSASTPPQARQERPASPLFREQPVLAPSFLEAGAPLEPCMYALHVCLAWFRSYCFRARRLPHLQYTIVTIKPECVSVTVHFPDRSSG